MSERRTAPSRDPIYSEADVAEMRSRWDDDQKERDRNNQLARLEGQMSQLPELVRAQVRQVLGEDKRADDVRRRADLRIALGYMGALMVLVVPIEDVLITWVRSH